VRLKVIISCLSLLCSLCTFSVKTSYALGWDDIGGCAVLACVPSVVKGAVNDTADHLTGDAKKLYLEVMNDFVSTKLPAMLSQFDMLASKHELKLNEMLDK
jgi:hypothetical protein